MKKILLLVLAIIIPSLVQAEVVMQKTEYAGWPNCIQISNGAIELIATTDVGPRIIRLGFTGAQNLFKEYEDQLGQTGGEEWRIYGGHRLWAAPEAMPRTYWPDNTRVDYQWDGKTLTLTPPPQTRNGIQLEMAVTLAPDSNHVRVEHRITNIGPWPITLAPWGLSAMAAGGRAIFPQEPYRPHEEYLLPARSLVLWHYANMSDPRWTWGERYIQLRQNPETEDKEKFGCLNKQGWAAYILGRDVLVVCYPYDPSGEYPDYGCNTESYTDASMLEVETLGPLTQLDPDGGQTVFTEDWFLLQAEVGETDEHIDNTLLPLVEKARSSLKE